MRHEGSYGPENVAEEPKRVRGKNEEGREANRKKSESKEGKSSIRERTRCVWTRTNEARVQESQTEGKIEGAEKG